MLDPSLVLAATCRLTNVTLAELCGPKRTKGLARARRSVFWLLHRESGLTFAEIGAQLCRDPSTVWAAVTSVDARMREHEDLVNRIKVESRDTSRLPPAMQSALAARATADELRLLADALEAGEVVDIEHAKRVTDMAARTIGLARMALRGGA
jgi:hypothetical protein